MFSYISILHSEQHSIQKKTEKKQREKERMYNKILYARHKLINDKKDNIVRHIK